MYEVAEKLLKDRGESWYQVGKATGIAPATFTNWKQGKYRPKHDKLKKLADYFGVSVDVFYN